MAWWDSPESLQQFSGTKDEGFSIGGWHPHLPNLGGITAAKQLIGGFQGLAEGIYQTDRSIVHGAYSAAHGDLGQAGEDFARLNPVSQNTPIGKFAYGLGYGLENLSTTVASGLGVPLTKYNAGDLGLAKLFEKLNEQLPAGQDAEGNDIPVYKPSSWSQREGGPIVGAVQDIGMVAAIAAPVAGALGKAATTAETSAAVARLGVEAGTVSEVEASALAARAVELSGRANIAKNFAHPYQFAGSRIADVVLGARDKVLPPNVVVPEVPETAAEVLARKGEAPPEPHPLEGVAGAEATAKAKRFEAASNQLVLDLKKTADAAADNAEPPPGSTIAGELAGTVEEAAAGVPDSAVAQATARRIATPAPAWAQRLVDKMPDTFNRILASAAGPIESARFKSVARDYGRLVETAQRAAQRSPAVATMNEAAAVLTEAFPEMDRFEISHIVGEETAAVATGSTLVEQYIKSGYAPEAMAALRRTARNGYNGLTDELRARLTPEQADRFTDAVNRSAGETKTLERQHLDTLLASRPGLRGIERAIMDDTSIPMSTRETAMYRKALKNLRREKLLRERVADAELARVAKQERAALLGARETDRARQLIARVGVLERTAADLKESVPVALRPEHIEATLDHLVERILSEGTYFDVGKAEELTEPSGPHVVIAPQWEEAILPETLDLPAMRERLRSTLTDPIGPDGEPYGPGLWGGNDVRLVAKIDHGTLRVGLGMSTWGGGDLEPWLAHGLGEMYHNVGAEFSGRADVQNLWAHYGAMALDQQSPFYNFARKLYESGKAAGMTDADINAALVWKMTLDYSLSKMNYAHELGDYFKAAKVDFGKRVPKGAGLYGQTVLDLSTHEGIVAALAHYDVHELNTHLQWYYESHDYIESMYRNKDVRLLDGSVRNGAELFYDLLAFTSVMASPTQNLGRALMGLSNLKDFHVANADALAAAKSLMKTLEDTHAESVTRTLGGQKIKASERWFTPEVRKLTEGTSMTTSPKYNVFDVLAGRLNLETATNKDIAELGLEWTGEVKSTALDNLDRRNVVTMLDAQGATGPGVDAYKAWVARREQAAADAQASHGRLVKPLTDAEDVQRKASEANPEARTEGGREVSPAEYQALARDGKSIVDEATDASEPTIDLLDPGFIEEMYKATHTKSGEDVGPNGEWGGGTLDTHTGTFHPTGSDAVPGDYAVTVIPKGAKSLVVDPSADLPTFTREWVKAVKSFGSTLEMKDGAFGIFHNAEREGGAMIELDPVLVTHSVHDTEAVGAYTRAKGGAFHFETFQGHWTPHVRDEFATGKSADAYLKQVRAEEEGLLKDPAVNAAHERALMEHHGSNLLAKMRNFRENLADPAESIGVTLDSVMAKMYGFSGNRWANADMMGRYSREIRTEAKLLEPILGYEPKPHEVQALLWVYTKQEIGRQDWGRLKAHEAMAERQLDLFQQTLDAGRPINAADYDPLRDYWDEELGYSNEAEHMRQRQTELEKKVSRYKKQAEMAGVPAKERKAAAWKRLKPAERAELEKLQSENWSDEPRREPIVTLDKNGQYVEEERAHIPYASGKLGSQRTRYDGKYNPKTRKVEGGYVQLRADMRTLLADGEIEQARQLLNNYVAKQQRSVEGDIGGSFQVVGEATRADSGKEPSSAYTAEQNLLTDPIEDVPAPDPWDAAQHRGDMGELHQKFQEKLRGALLLTPDRYGRLTMRLFENAAIDTLAHEGGHLLRQILKPEQLDQLTARYPRLLDTTLTAEKVAAEEKFVADMMYYMRRAVKTGTHDGPLADVFERISATLEEQHAALMDTAYARSFNADISDFWDRLFHPEIDNPARTVDPLDLRRVTSPGNAETRRFRWESEAEFAQRTRQYGEARANVEAARYKAALASRTAAKAEAAARRMLVAIQTSPNDIALEADRLHASAYATLERLGRSLDNPTNSQVPREWRPMWEAFQGLRKEAAENPAVAEMLEEVPTTWSQVLKAAADHGFEPTYLPELTWEQAQTKLFGHVRLGKQDVGTQTLAGARRENKGVLRRNELGDRSMEALAAGMHDAVHELYSNKLIDFVEKNAARPFQHGAVIPKGWVPWDPEKQYILTGTRATGERTAVGAEHIIPIGVKKALDSMSKEYQHWVFHVITKLTSPWRTMLLTLSPKWYVNNIGGNTILATLEGARWRDWKVAWRQAREGTLPNEVSGQSFVHSFDEGNVSSLIPHRSLQATKAVEGNRAALRVARQKMVWLNEIVDQMARGAVFEKTLRTTGSREAAMTRASVALVDYGNLSAFERSFVRAVIPFYAWQKGVLKLVMRMPSDHPLATVVLMQLGKIHEEELQDRLGGAIPEAYEGLTDVFGMHNLRGLNPFQDAVGLATPKGIAQSANPYIDLIVRMAYQQPEYGTGQPGMTPTGAPASDVNPLAALGKAIGGFPQVRLAAQATAGGDVYGKDPGLVGGLAGFLGAPSSPNVSNIQQTVGETTGNAQPTTYMEALQAALARPQAAARRPRTAQQKAVSAAVRARRHPKRIRLRKPRKRRVRLPARRTGG